jgi:arylsulfatase A-like enzyme
MKINRIFFIALYAVLCFNTNNAIGQDAGNKPNVVFIMTDDQGMGDLGCYGNTIIKTPTIDKIYNEGVHLDNFHVSTTCAPTRGALMTGRHTNRLNCFHTIAGRSLLFEDEVLLPQILAQNGYATAMFGKWHLGDNYPFRPEDRGFQKVVRHGGGGITQGPDYWGNDYFDDHYWVRNEDEITTHTEAFKGYCTDVFFEEAKAFIKAKKDVPFFAYISPNAPHGPLNLPIKYYNQYKDEKKLTEQHKRFYGMVTNIDDNIKELQSLLKKLKIEKNTILVFMTDNGTGHGRPKMVNGEKFGFDGGLRGYKASQYEGGHRVPFMVYWPDGKITGGKQINTLLAHYDVLPTMVDLLKLRDIKTKPLDGISFAPLLSDPASKRDNRILYIDTQRLQNLVKGRKYTVMDDRWRLVDGKELYDVDKDLAQKNNIITEHPEVAARLAEGYEKWWDSFDVDALNSTYAHIKVGSKYENPSRISVHDMLSGKLNYTWHQYGATKADKANGRWKIEFMEEGAYTISLRRFPHESKLGINETFPAIKKSPEFESTMPKATKTNFKKGYLYVADFEAEKIIEKGAEEVVFEVKVPKGKFDLEASFFDAEERIFPVYYLYINKL